jgi:hypothetical protein
MNQLSATLILANTQEYMVRLRKVFALDQKRGQTPQHQQMPWSGALFGSAGNTEGYLRSGTFNCLIL